MNTRFKLSDLNQNPALEVLSEVPISLDAMKPESVMKIALVTDKMIENSGIKQVTDPISFSSGKIPTPEGLFSEEIFGRDPESRRRLYAYIDLHEKFFHPYVYEVLKFMMPKKFEKCASGQGRWKIGTEGELVELKKDSPDYDKGDAGIPWLIKNFKKLKFEETGSMIRADRIKLLKGLSDEELFISKWLVIPVLYRDVNKNDKIFKLPELDDAYNSLIRYANSLRDSTFDFYNDQVRFNLQNDLVTIRKYGQGLVEKKHGFFHKAILGKSIDRGSLDVISVATMTGYQRPEDNPVDIFHSGIPLAKCLIIGYDFILRYCLNFFADNLRNVTEYPVYKLINGTYKVVGTIKLKDQIERFSSKYIEKKINRFKNSHGTRFELITLETEDGKEIPMHLSGAFGPLAITNPRMATQFSRPMTWTDLFYLAAEETISDKYVYITRYPITSHSSIFPSQVRVLSTIKTQPAYINGKLYRHYPVIDLKTPTNKISNLFNDTVTMSNLYLDALGGDYDGDTISAKLMFSIEANEEAKRIAESVRSFVSPDGTMLRKLGNEAYLTFYNMTREESAPPLNSELKKELLKLKKEDLTINSIAELFGNTTSIDKTKGKQKGTFDITPPKFNIRSKFVLNPGEYINQEQITTTVGKFLFNKLMVENSLEEIVPNGYYNEIVNKKMFGKLSDIVANGIMSGKIQIKPTVYDFLSAYEFWGLGLVAIFAPSYSMGTIIPNPKLKEMKDKLLKEAPDHRLATLSNIEQTLIKEADKVTAGEPGKHLFDSGARGSFSNDFKNMAVTIGLVENPITGEYDFMKSNYIEGIKKEDIPAAANIIVNAEYPKAIGTAQGGYMTKQFYAVFQSLMIDEHGSDCGTTVGLKVTITKDNLNDYIDQYIIGPKNQLILITEDLSSEYMNHPVMVRSPMFCLSDNICNKCMGERFYKVGIPNVGLTTTAMTGKLQTASLKLRHSLAIKLDMVDSDSLLI